MAHHSRFLTKYLVDLALWTAVTPLAFWIRLEDPWLDYTKEIVAMMLLGVAVKGGVLSLFGFPQRSWRKIGVRDLFSLMQAVTLVTGLLALFAYAAPTDLVVPRSVPLIEGMLALLLLGWVRLVVRLRHESRQHRSLLAVSRGRPKRVLIVGAGEAGTMVARELLRHPEAGLLPVGFLDDDPGKLRRRFLGLRVLGPVDALPHQVQAHDIDEVLIAVPSEGGRTVRRIVALAREAGVEHRTIPGIYELLSGAASISQIRDVDVADLLRREPVRLDDDDIQEYITDRVVLVTGAGGSIGSEIVRQIARFAPARVLLLGRGENSIYEIEQECRQNWPKLQCVPIIADIRDRDKLTDTFERHRPQVVFHAAAYKHVPLMEANPDEAVLNNVGGTKNLVELALLYGVERFVNISTDKAVNPTSVMGATKRTAEYVVEWGARRAAAGQQFVSVRFGNVLGSRGSVVPLFKKQIQRGGPITITHPEMKRYFMTIPEAAQLVLQAGGLGANGSVYVLDMGEPVRIMDLARDLIMLSGLVPDVDIQIQVTGMRPGEKLFEELLTAEEGTIASRHEKIFVARKNGLPDRTFEVLLNELLAAARTGNGDYIRDLFRSIIPTHLLGEAEAQAEPHVGVAHTG